MINNSIIRKCTAILALTVSAAFMLEACAQEQKPVEKPTGITMTTKASEVYISVAGAKDIVIDWGDGKKSNMNDGSFAEAFGTFNFFQDFSGTTTARNIVITGNIEQLIVSGNELTALDVSRDTTLTHLSCFSNQLTALDVSRNTALTSLNCHNNQLTTLDVSKNTALEDLLIDHNQLTTLDVSNNTALKNLHCPDNRITSVNMNAACPERLYWIDVKNNQLTGSALNDLFRVLPDRTKIVADFNEEINSGSISILGNPGYFDCAPDIVRERGWRFYVR